MKIHTTKMPPPHRIRQTIILSSDSAIGGYVGNRPRPPLGSIQSTLQKEVVAKSVGDDIEVENDDMVPRPPESSRVGDEKRDNLMRGRVLVVQDTEKEKEEVSAAAPVPETNNDTANSCISNSVTSSKLRQSDILNGLHKIR